MNNELVFDDDQDDIDQNEEEVELDSEVLASGNTRRQRNRGINSDARRRIEDYLDAKRLESELNDFFLYSDE